MFYDKFMDLCLAHDISPTAACKKMSIAVSSIQNWRSGGAPFDSTRRKVAAFFCVPVEYFDEAPAETSAASSALPAPAPVDAEAVRVAALRKKLSDDPDRRALFYLLENATGDELRQAAAILDALRRTRRE